MKSTDSCPPRIQSAGHGEPWTRLNVAVATPVSSPRQPRPEHPDDYLMALLGIAFVSPSLRRGLNLQKSCYPDSRSQQLLRLRRRLIIHTLHTRRGRDGRNVALHWVRLICQVISRARWTDAHSWLCELPLCWLRKQRCSIQGEIRRAFRSWLVYPAPPHKPTHLE